MAALGRRMLPYARTPGRTAGAHQGVISGTRIFAIFDIFNPKLPWRTCPASLTPDAGSVSNIYLNCRSQTAIFAIFDIFDRPHRRMAALGRRMLPSDRTTGLTPGAHQGAIAGTSMFAIFAIFDFFAANNLRH